MNPFRIQAGRRPRSASVRGLILLVPALLVSVLSACDGTGPEDDAYTLTAVGGALPGQIPCCGGGVEATGGSLELGDDDTVVQRLDLRCMPGSTCTIPEEWEVMMGALDRDAGLVTWNDDRTSQAVLEEGVITLRQPLPPSSGTFGSVPFRFER